MNNTIIISGYTLLASSPLPRPSAVLPRGNSPYFLFIPYFRSIYTKRIVEIISNVDKQNIEIKKILEDTRQLQKEINILEGQLERSFSVADETLFRVSNYFPK